MAKLHLEKLGGSVNLESLERNTVLERNRIAIRVSLALDADPLL